MIWEAIIFISMKIRKGDLKAVEKAILNHLDTLPLLLQVFDEIIPSLQTYSNDLNEKIKQISKFKLIIYETMC